MYQLFSLLKDYQIMYFDEMSYSLWNEFCIYVSPSILFSESCKCQGDFMSFLGWTLWLLPWTPIPLADLIVSCVSPYH